MSRLDKTSWVRAAKTCSIPGVVYKSSGFVEVSDAETRMVVLGMYSRVKGMCTDSALSSS